jgi:hypothetical protein
MKKFRRIVGLKSPIGIRLFRSTGDRRSARGGMTRGMANAERIEDMTHIAIDIRSFSM